MSIRRLFLDIFGCWSSLFRCRNTGDILCLPPEMLVEIATYLGTTRNLSSFKTTCSRIYNAIESAEKVDRKRLPHLKIQRISFDYAGASEVKVRYRKKDSSSRRRFWDYSNPLSTKLRILIQHWILEDNCQIKFCDDSILNIPLLISLSKINYGNAIECELFCVCSNPGRHQEALPFILQFLKKVNL